MNEMMLEETKQQLGEDMNILDKGGSMNHGQKKVWQWVLDGMVWLVCVAAFVWVLSTTRMGVMR